MTSHYDIPTNSRSTYSTTGNGKKIDNLHEKVLSLEARVGELESKVEALEDDDD